MKTASWVIVRLADGAAVFETYDQCKVNFLNTAKYRAIPILEYLVSLNK